METENLKRNMFLFPCPPSIYTSPFSFLQRMGPLQMSHWQVQTIHHSIRPLVWGICSHPVHSPAKSWVGKTSATISLAWRRVNIKVCYTLTTLTGPSFIQTLLVWLFYITTFLHLLVLQNSNMARKETEVSIMLISHQIRKKIRKLEFRPTHPFRQEAGLYTNQWFKWF